MKNSENDPTANYTTAVSQLPKWRYPFTKLYWWCLWLQLLGKLNPKTVTYHAIDIAEDDPIRELLYNPEKKEKKP